MAFNEAVDHFKTSFEEVYHQKAGLTNFRYEGAYDEQPYMGEENLYDFVDVGDKLMDESNSRFDDIVFDEIKRERRRTTHYFVKKAYGVDEKDVINMGSSLAREIQLGATALLSAKNGTFSKAVRDSWFSDVEQVNDNDTSNNTTKSWNSLRKSTEAANAAKNDALVVPYNLSKGPMGTSVNTMNYDKFLRAREVMVDIHRHEPEGLGLGQLFMAMSQADLNNLAYTVANNSLVLIDKDFFDQQGASMLATTGTRTRYLLDDVVIIVDPEMSSITRTSSGSVSGVATPGSVDIRRIPMWHKSGVRCQKRMLYEARVDVRNDKFATVQVSSYGQISSTRTQESRIIEIEALPR